MPGSIDSQFQQPITGSFTALAQSFDLTSPNSGTSVIQLTGTWSGTLVVEGSNDNTNWITLQVMSTSTFLFAASITANGIYITNTNGYQFLRIRSSAWTSGTGVLTGFGADATSIDYTLSLLRGATDGTLIGNNGNRLLTDVTGTVTANAGTNLNTSALALETTQSAQNTLIGAVTETAPASDTASSGLNGRLQRIAQRITSLIALIPTSLGQKASAASLAVVLSTEQEAEIGALTETAPATDIASSGLNGRLQRIAQRLTSLIALIPSSVGIAWFSRISDGTDTAAVATQGDLKVADGLKSGGVQGQVSVPTVNVPVEAKVGASRLTNRKFLQITANNTGLFYGFDNTVTTTSGTPIANNASVSFSIDSDSTFQVWVVGNGNGKSIQVLESP